MRSVIVALALVLALPAAAQTVTDGDSRDDEQAADAVSEQGHG
jgi:hypothetical protein